MAVDFTPKYNLALPTQGQGAATGDVWDDDINDGVTTALENILYGIAAASCCINNASAL